MIERFIPKGIRIGAVLAELTFIISFPFDARVSAADDGIRVSGYPYCSTSYSSNSLSPFYEGRVTGIPRGQEAAIRLSGLDAYWLVDSSNPGQRIHEPIRLENGRDYTLYILAVDSIEQSAYGRSIIASNRILYSRPIQGVNCDSPLAPSRYEIKKVVDSTDA